MYFCLTDKIKKKFSLNTPDADLSSLIDVIRAFRGFDTYCVARQCGKNRFKLSLRADTDKVDVCALCKRFGGGGHTRAAGCTIEGDARRIYKTLCAALEARNK